MLSNAYTNTAACHGYTPMADAVPGAIKELQLNLKVGELLYFFWSLHVLELRAPWPQSNPSKNAMAWAKYNLMFFMVFFHGCGPICITDRQPFVL